MPDPSPPSHLACSQTALAVLCVPILLSSFTGVMNVGARFEAVA